MGKDFQIFSPFALSLALRDEMSVEIRIYALILNTV